MIFDSNMSAASATNWDAVQESPYALGVEGALMHVYENECNYNAIMKAAGVSELKYYKENGGDLFVQEAGAAGGLIDRFVAFFKKVIEKIKQMFKKLVMKISSYVSSDKTFVNKYKKEVLKSYKNNEEYVPKDVLESIGKTEVDEVTGKEVDITDYNYLYRAGKAFMKQYGENYKDWIEAEVINGNIESRGDEYDNLADFFKLYLKEYNGKEFTAEETKRMANYEWKQFNKYSSKLL